MSRKVWCLFDFKRKEVQTIEKRDKKVIFKNLRFVEKEFRIRRNENENILFSLTLKLITEGLLKAFNFPHHSFKTFVE